MPLGNAHLQLLAARKKSEEMKEGKLGKKSPGMSFQPRSRLSSEDSINSTSCSTMAGRSRLTSAMTSPREDSFVLNSAMMSPREDPSSDNEELQELQEKYDDLQLQYEEKCNELVECQQDLKATRMEVEELRILLKAKSGRTSSIPEVMGTGNAGSCENPQAEELRRLFVSLADQVVLEQPMHYNANCDLVMAGEFVRMREIVQWCFKDSDLKLTVPQEMAAEITSLVTETKNNPGSMCGAKAKAIIDCWTLTTSPALSETTSAVTLLTHRLTGSSCVVANFPTPPPEPLSPVLAMSMSPALAMAPAPLPPQPMALPPLNPAISISVGDVVEVDYEGEWLRGTIKYLDNDDLAHVQCDCDPPGVLTTTPLNFLRLPLNSSEPVPLTLPPQVTQNFKITYSPALPAQNLAGEPATPPRTRIEDERDPSTPSRASLAPQEGLQNCIPHEQMFSGCTYTHQRAASQESGPSCE
jgi:hypothetical protein